MPERCAVFIAELRRAFGARFSLSLAGQRLDNARYLQTSSAECVR